MDVLRSLPLFVLAAVAEIGGAWLVWQGVREQRGMVWIGAGIVALGVYGFVATLQPDAHFGRILAATSGSRADQPDAGMTVRGRAAMARLSGSPMTTSSMRPLITEG